MLRTDFSYESAEHLAEVGVPWKNPHHSERQPRQVRPLHYLPPPGGSSKEEETFLPSRGSGDVEAQVPIPGLGVPAFLYQLFYQPRRLTGAVNLAPCSTTALSVRSWV